MLIASWRWWFFPLSLPSPPISQEGSLAQRLHFILAAEPWWEIKLVVTAIRFHSLIRLTDRLDFLIRLTSIPSLRHLTRVLKVIKKADVMLKRKNGARSIRTSSDLRMKRESDLERRLAMPALSDKLGICWFIAQIQLSRPLRRTVPKWKLLATNAEGARRTEPHFAF